MALKYYPLNRILAGLYTRGDKYKTPDGNPYVGKYYVTYTGQPYTGVNPVLGTNLPLTELTKEQETLLGGRQLNQSTETYTAVRANNGSTGIRKAEDGRLTELVPYYPSPSESDYSRGYFTRYFAKIVSGPGYVFEISPLDWSKIQNGDIQAENILGYETIDILWQLTGPLNDTRISQYQIKGGVQTTNKRVTETKNKVFNGLIDFIGGNYTKFARITP